MKLIGMAVEVAAAQTRYEMKICRNLFHLTRRWLQPIRVFLRNGAGRRADGFLDIRAMRDRSQTLFLVPK
jgi:hypothetical protein